MEAFVVSLSTVGIAEMGDRTQFLALLLAARYRNLTPAILDGVVGLGLLAMAFWISVPIPS